MGLDCRDQEPTETVAGPLSPKSLCLIEKLLSLAAINERGSWAPLATALSPSTTPGRTGGSALPKARDFSLLLLAGPGDLSSPS